MAAGRGAVVERLTDGASAANPAEPPIERLHIERRGGLAGLRASADCAWAGLTAGQRIALQRVLAAGAPRPATPGADRYTYRVQVTRTGAADLSLDLSEDAMPAALASLVRPTLP